MPCLAQLPLFAARDQGYAQKGKTGEYAKQDNMRQIPVSCPMRKRPHSQGHKLRLAELNQSTLADIAVSNEARRFVIGPNAG